MLVSWTRMSGSSVSRAQSSSRRQFSEKKSAAVRGEITRCKVHNASSSVSSSATAIQPHDRKMTMLCDACTYASSAESSAAEAGPSGRARRGSCAWRRCLRRRR
eukprot:2961015-Prymnesium_polylepis.1